MRSKKFYLPREDWENEKEFRDKGINPLILKARGSKGYRNAFLQAEKTYTPTDNKTPYQKYIDNARMFADISNSFKTGNTPDDIIVDKLKTTVDAGLTKLPPLKIRLSKLFKWWR